MTRLLLFSFLILQLTGCASWLDSDYRDPEVRLVKVEAVKMHLLEQEFVLHVRVDNPNDGRLFIRYLSYTVHLNDLLLVEGRKACGAVSADTPGGPSRSPCAPTSGNRSNRWRKCSKTLNFPCVTASMASSTADYSSPANCTYRAVVR